MDPGTGFAAWFGTQVVAPKIAERTISTMQPRWESKLSRRAIRQSGVRVSKRRLRSWLRLKPTWSYLTRLDSADVEALRISLRPLVADARRHRNLSDARIDQNTDDLLTHVMACFLGALDPSVALDVADYRRHGGFRNLKQGQDQILAVLDRGHDFDVNLECLPPTVAPLLRAAHESSPNDTENLATGLSDVTQNPATISNALATSPPSMLTNGDIRLLEAYGEFASAHGANEDAFAAFELLFERSASRRARIAARASLIARELQDSTSAGHWLEVAKNSTGEGDAYVQFAESIVSGGEPETVDAAITEALLTDPDTRLTALSAQAQARTISGRATEAIVILGDAVAEFPTSSGIRLQLARLLADRSINARTDGGFSDLSMACQLALEARDLRRRWRGSSEEPTTLAAQIALQRGDFAEVLQLTLQPPEGEALELEATASGVRAIAAIAAIATGRPELAEQLAAAEDSTPSSDLIRGWLLQEQGDLEAARSAFHAAYESADADSDRSMALTALAMSGEWPLPGWADLSESVPTQADELVLWPHTLGVLGLVDEIAHP